MKIIEKLPKDSDNVVRTIVHTADHPITVTLEPEEQELVFRSLANSQIMMGPALRGMDPVTPETIKIYDTLQRLIGKFERACDE